MIRSELVQKIADENPHLILKDVTKVVNIVFEQITSSMEQGNRVELRDFGSFTARHRLPRIGRNPTNGEVVMVEEKHVPRFKIGKGLFDRLNGKA